MEGGIKAWNGTLAEGPPDAATITFPPQSSPAEHLSIAWLLEEGAREFYAKVRMAVGDDEVAGLFGELSAAEEQHKAMLSALYDRIGGGSGTLSDPSLLPGSQDAVLMEGGMRVEDALAWAAGRQVNEILELCVSLETNAFDRYLIMARESEHEYSKEVFRVISSEERRHLDRLAALLDERLPGL